MAVVEIRQVIFLCSHAHITERHLLQPRSGEMENGEDEESPDDDRGGHSSEVLDQVCSHADPFICLNSSY